MRRDPDIIYRRGSQRRGVVYPSADTVETLRAVPGRYTGRPFYGSTCGVPEIRRLAPHKVIYERPIPRAACEGKREEESIDALTRSVRIPLPFDSTLPSILILP